MVAVDTATARAWQDITAAGSGGHTVALQGHVLGGDGTRSIEPLPITDCQWGWDGASTAPLSATLTVPAVDWSRAPAVDWRPASMWSAVTPFGNRIEVTVTVDGGDRTATIPLGVGLISQVAYARPAETLTITLTDLSAELQQAVTVVDFALLADTPLPEVLAAVLSGSGVHIVPPLVGVPAGTVKARTWPPGTSCWQIIQEACAAVSASLRAWFDRSGALRVGVLATDVFPSGQTPGAPVWRLGTGTGGHLTEMESVLSRDGVVNTVAVAVEDSEVADAVYADIHGEETGMAVSDLDKLERLSGGGTGFARPLRKASVAFDDSGGTWVPRPDDNRGHLRSPRQMVEWARGQVGSGWPDQHCLAWVSTAILGRESYGGAYARYVWENKPASVTTWPKDPTPPKGALCVWNGAVGHGAGHIGISIGDGWMISATGGRVGKQRIATFAVGGLANYYGAVVPY